MRATVVLAVLPEYRRNFVEELGRSMGCKGDNLLIVAGDSHTDDTVRTSVLLGAEMVTNVHLLGRRLFWQRGAIRFVRGADVVVVDLNPRSLTAWMLLIRGKLTGVRTLAWGHILPRAGEGARTVPVRRAMRRLAAGVISYTWSDATRVLEEGGNERVWVAANGLYPREMMEWDTTSKRKRFLYVGRLEPSKKPELILEAFFGVVDQLPNDVAITFVGSGSLEASLMARAKELDIDGRVDFRGHVGDYEVLRQLYSETIASLSPGYVGLSLTQSLGFGVPMIVADNEPHAPEVELLTSSTGLWFEADSSTSLGQRMVELALDDDIWEHSAIVSAVQSTYASSAMASGFEDALRGLRGRGSDA